ncbi:MAG: hypothetical protein HC795_15010 [Coleofasciculaceae cyanobacterium RL_1_1]|nr:hypothetical protein [Coleofasciculaceae cyanobacterium RL_1_1]
MNAWTRNAASVMLLTGCWLGLVEPIVMGVRAQSRPAETEDRMSDTINPEDTDSDSEVVDGDGDDSVRSQVLEALELETREFIEALRDRQVADDRRDRLIPRQRPSPIHRPFTHSNFRDPAEWRAYPLGPGDQVNIVLQPPLSRPLNSRRHRL